MASVLSCKCPEAARCRVQEQDEAACIERVRAQCIEGRPPLRGHAKCNEV